MSDTRPFVDIQDLVVGSGDNVILNGCSLSIERGEIHAIMGPNGSGKSTLANVLAGQPEYEVRGGRALVDGVDILTLTPEERAHQGLFLAFQYPVEIPGVSNMSFEVSEGGVGQPPQGYRQRPPAYRRVHEEGARHRHRTRTRRRIP